MPLHTVAPESLRDYIVAQKAVGWVCVALEQAAHSVLPGSAACQLPDRMLLVQKSGGVHAALTAFVQLRVGRRDAHSRALVPIFGGFCRGAMGRL